MQEHFQKTLLEIRLSGQPCLHAPAICLFSVAHLCSLTTSCNTADGRSDRRATGFLLPNPRQPNRHGGDLHKVSFFPDFPTILQEHLNGEKTGHPWLARTTGIRQAEKSCFSCQREGWTGLQKDLWSGLQRGAPQGAGDWQPQRGDEKLLSWRNPSRSTSCLQRSFEQP